MWNESHQLGSSFQSKKSCSCGGPQRRHLSSQMGTHVGCNRPLGAYNLQRAGQIGLVLSANPRMSCIIKLCHDRVCLPAWSRFTWNKIICVSECCKKSGHTSWRRLHAAAVCCQCSKWQKKNTRCEVILQKESRRRAWIWDKLCSDTKRLLFFYWTLACRAVQDVISDRTVTSAERAQYTSLFCSPLLLFRAVENKFKHHICIC